MDQEGPAERNPERASPAAAEPSLGEGCGSSKMRAGPDASSTQGEEPSLGQSHSKGAATLGERGARSPFRLAAVEYFRHGLKCEGDVLRVSPLWVDAAFWLLMLLLATALLFCFLGRVSTYAQGIGVVRLEGAREVVVPANGVVKSIHVRPGQTIAARQPLATLFMESLGGAVSVRGSAVSIEMPADSVSIEAPCDGVVGRIHLRAGTSASAGTLASSIVTSGTRASLLLAFPARSRPWIRPGALMRLTPYGFHDAVQDAIALGAMDEEIVGATELRNFLGADAPELARIDGPFVLGRAFLPTRAFRSAGQLFNFFEGMSVQVEVRTGTEPLISLIIPGVRRMLSHGDQS
jgi:hypothetical protein